MKRRYGVDGCKAGWFYFAEDEGIITHGVTASLKALLDGTQGASVFIDIPIGLVNDDCRGRYCDREARKVLGARRSSVFSAPCRAVLEATSYKDARERSVSAIGKSISAQAFALVPKIKEVDELIRSSGSSSQIREVHPEVCFWALNGAQPMQYPKKDSKGFDERMKVLDLHFLTSSSLVENALSQYPKKSVQRDDIVDALVALVTATAPISNQKTLPDVPQVDSYGLPMEMVYRKLAKV